MPAVSNAQRRAMAIAEHHPEKLRKKNTIIYLTSFIPLAIVILALEKTGLGRSVGGKDDKERKNPTR